MVTLRIEPSVTVITPSIANPYLVQAIESVTNQTYNNVKHLVVADGREYFQKILNLPIVIQDGNNLTITSVPFNTGGNGQNGQRIYAAFAHLINTDYICFLDEDNWLDKDHVASLIDLCVSGNHAFTHSLRKVYVKDKYLADDCCEAIGRWPIAWSDGTQHLVDTSAYCFKTDFLKQVSYLWNSGGWGEDRRFFMALKDKVSYGTTGLHTLNYRLPNMELAYGGDYDIFEKGNEIIRNQHEGKYPWQK